MKTNRQSNIQSGQQVSHEEQAVVPAEVPVSHNDSQPDISSNKEEQSILPPFSGNLPVDKDLELSHDNFKQSIKTLVKKERSSDTVLLNSVPPYPTPYLLAQFASLAYQNYLSSEHDRDYEKRLAPSGWKLLTTAVNKQTTNGYFGAAYWHPERQHVVIAYFGTQLKNLGADWADLKGGF
ncbi:unnamed protein product [Sphagnum jensenii]|uniref:Uncharacterized protein n=1 Tax=Sphagnum jensenii TaxID=128206 RepID=A0ABP0VFM0_9BRYO